MPFKMTRLRAFWIHLCLSALSGLLLLALFAYVWYPGPLFDSLGGLKIFLVLLSVDVGLGPFLTFVVFNPAKKSLKFDLAAIVLVQVAALTYGVYTLLAGRPVYVAALGHRFDLVQAGDVDPIDLVKAGKRLPWWGPEWVGTRIATDPKERERVLFSAVGGVDYGHYPQHHAPLGSMRSEIMAKALPISELERFNPGRVEDIRAWLVDRGLTESSAVFQGLKARNEDMAVIINKRTGDVIGIAPFKPWE